MVSYHLVVRAPSLNKPKVDIRCPLLLQHISGACEQWVAYDFGDGPFIFAARTE